MDDKEVRSLIFDLFMTALMGMFFFLSFTYNSKARFVPLIIATPTFALAIWRSVMGIISWRRTRTVKSGTETSAATVGVEMSDAKGVGTSVEDTAATEEVMARAGVKPDKDRIAELKAQANDIAHLSQTSPAAINGSRWRREVMAAVWIFILLAMVWLLGFIWTIPIYILLVLRVRSKEPWKLSVGISLGAWIFLYILFVFLLKIEFTTGFLIGLFL